MNILTYSFARSHTIRTRMINSKQHTGMTRTGKTVASTIVKVLSVLELVGGTTGQGPLCKGIEYEATSKR